MTYDTVGPPPLRPEYMPNRNRLADSAELWGGEGRLPPCKKIGSADVYSFTGHLAQAMGGGGGKHSRKYLTRY